MYTACVIRVFYNIYMYVHVTHIHVYIMPVCVCVCVCDVCERLSAARISSRCVIDIRCEPQTTLVDNRRWFETHYAPTHPTGSYCTNTHTISLQPPCACHTLHVHCIYTQRFKLRNDFINAKQTCPFFR